jgi:hypothetical protein
MNFILFSLSEPLVSDVKLIFVLLSSCLVVIFSLVDPDSDPMDL